MFVNMSHQRGRKFQVQVYKLKSDCAEVGERRRRMHCKGSRFGTEKRSSCIAQWMLALLPLRVLTASKTSCAVEPGIGLTPCSWISDDGATHFGRERFVSLLPSELTFHLEVSMENKPADARHLVVRRAILDVRRAIAWG